jgi:hypothetical protein
MLEKDVYSDRPDIRQNGDNSWKFKVTIYNNFYKSNKDI